MKNTIKFSFMHCAVIFILVLFMPECIASSNQTAKATKPKHISLGEGFIRLGNIDHRSSEAVDLFGLNVRYGIVKGFDVGFAHTFDFTAGHTAGTVKSFASVSGDIKAQLFNWDNEIGKPILSLGLGIDYFYNKKKIISSFSLFFGFPFSDNISSTLQYRPTLISNDGIKDLLHGFSGGLEYSFFNPAIDNVTTKIELTLGTINSSPIYVGDRELTVNLGISFEGPVFY